MIKKLRLIPTRKQYQDTYQRTLDLQLNATGLNMLEAMFHNEGVVNNSGLNNNAVATSLPGVINYSATSTGIADIVNGWATQRLRFILEVEDTVGHNTLVSYIQGYSEYYDPAQNGKVHVDDNMLFHVNSITNVTKTVSPATGELIVRPHSTYNVISDQYGGSKYEEIMSPETDFKMVRPVDLVNDIQTLELDTGLGTEFHTFTGTLHMSDTVSRRSNNDPIEYFTKTVNAYTDAKNTSNMSADATGIIKAASTNLKEPTTNSISFMYQLHKITGEVTPTAFTMNNLNTMTGGNIKSVIEVMDKSFEAIQDMSVPTNFMDTEHTEVLYKADKDTQIVNSIIHTLNTYMAESLLSNLSIQVTNMAMEPVITPLGFDSFITGINAIPYVEMVKSKIRTSLLPQITQNNVIGVEFIFTSDLLGDTSISLSLNGAPPVVYRMPTFADSLYNPMVTTKENSSALAHDFNVVLDATYGTATAESIMV